MIILLKSRGPHFFGFGIGDPIMIFMIINIMILIISMGINHFDDLMDEVIDAHQSDQPSDHQSMISNHIVILRE